jgi:D-aminoacyl-tRNA deacylase
VPTTRPIFHPSSRATPRCQHSVHKRLKVCHFWTSVVNSRLYSQTSSILNPAMRVVIQRVSEAAVRISGQAKSAIGEGLLVLAAFEESDTKEDVDWMSGKIARLRIFSDEKGLMNRSVQETGGDVLLVSQFTLFASTRKGNRPSYSRSARPEVAIPIYEAFITQLANDLGKPIKTGSFGAAMQITLVNDGPVTIVIDSRQRE